MKQLILSMSFPSPPSCAYCINLDISPRSTKKKKNASWRTNRAMRQHCWKGKRLPCLLIKCFDIKINQDVILSNLPVRARGAVAKGSQFRLVASGSRHSSLFSSSQALIGAVSVSTSHPYGHAGSWPCIPHPAALVLPAAAAGHGAAAGHVGQGGLPGFGTISSLWL